MKVVDPHIHLWDTQRVNFPWLDNPGDAYHGDNRQLPNCHDAETFLNNVGDIDVAMSVNVEANPADPIAEAQWLQSLADNPAHRGHPHGIVGCADLSANETAVLFERLGDIPNMRGVRQILNVHSNPRYDYVGRHYMEESNWRANLKRLARYNWSFDLQIYPAQMPLAVEVIRENPDINFVVNHAGMFVDRDSVAGWRQWRDGLRLLASCENVAIKLSGFAMFDHHWTLDSFRPLILETIDAFGVARCMFASNFPIDGLHSSYAELWHAYAEIVAGVSAAEREQLFLSNAQRYYRL